MHRGHRHERYSFISFYFLMVCFTSIPIKMLAMSRPASSPLPGGECCSTFVLLVFLLQSFAQLHSQCVLSESSMLVCGAVVCCFYCCVLFHRLVVKQCLSSSIDRRAGGFHLDAFLNKESIHTYSFLLGAQVMG